jgi:hypothetical protein
MERYILRARSANGAAAFIERGIETEDGQLGVAGHGLDHPNDAQHEAHEIAFRLVRRNGPGDREAALEALRAAFDEVSEETLPSL